MKSMHDHLMLTGMLIATLAACGPSLDKAPKKQRANNAAPNNVTPNNVTPHNAETCVSVTPPNVNFGEVPRGGAAEGSVTLANCATTQSLRIDGVTAVDGFDVTLPELAQLQPQTSTDVSVLFVPTRDGSHVGEVTIETSAGSAVVTVQGLGTSGDPSCPTPVAQGRISSAEPWVANVITTPETTVELPAMNSVVSGAIKSYEWTIASRPVGSAAQVSPSSTQNPSLFLDLRGAYEVDLRVNTASSPQGCPAARMRIDAVGDQDADEILVQLVWDTPADEDQTDSVGTDLDLHYLHPAGMWKAAPYDCYWGNKNANWGADGEASVDIDDLDGMGPENITHRNAGPLRYAVGVYYFADNGFGASTATVRVYRGTAKIAERSMLLNGKDEFWYVGFFDAAIDMFTPVDSLSLNFPARP